MRGFWKRLWGWKECPDCECWHKWIIFGDCCGQCGMSHYIKKTGAAPDWEGFGRAMMERWPTGDVDEAELFGLSLKYGLIAEVPGGYDPEQHIDAECICPEKGDPWYEYTFREDSK